MDLFIFLIYAHTCAYRIYHILIFKALEDEFREGREILIVLVFPSTLFMKSMAKTLKSGWSFENFM